MSSSLVSALEVDIMWALGCPVIRCEEGVGAVPHLFLVLILSTLRGVRTSRFPIDLASYQSRPKYFARHFSYEKKADRLSLLCSRDERLKSQCC